MRILHGAGFSEEERARAVEVIFQTVHSQMLILAEGADEFSIRVENEDALRSFHTLDHSRLDPGSAHVIATLWADPGIQAVYERRSSMQLDDSAK